MVYCDGFRCQTALAVVAPDVLPTLEQTLLPKSTTLLSGVHEASLLVGLEGLEPTTLSM